MVNFDLAAKAKAKRQIRFGGLILIYNRKEGTMSVYDPTLPTFLSGRIGIYKTLDAVKTAFEEKGCRIGDWWAYIMTKPAFILSQEEQDVEWVVVSGRQLGFTKSYTSAALIDRAEKQFGLDRCQPEDGVYIRLGYLNQPYGESWLPLAMDPITDSEGNLNIFSVCVDEDGLSLKTDTDYLDSGWIPEHKWLLRRRK